VLREHFDTVFARYEREQWRWVDPEDPEVQVRASFLRLLSLGGDDFAPVHESGLELHGAYVHEDLDLSGCTIPQPLLFRRSYFAGRISFRHSVTKSMTLSSSRVQSIDAESAQIRGGVFLENGFRSIAGASLAFATIGGSLSCSGSLLDGGSGLAFTGDEARIAGDVELADSFLGQGGVSLSGAKIEGKLHCARGTFQNRTEDGSGVALGCDDVEIMGGARLTGGFHSEGLVSFSGARIGGTLDCSGGTFLNHTADGRGEALSLAFAKIAENVWLRDGFSAEGKVRLYGTHVAGNVQCIGGRFANAAPAKDDRSIAASAISLRSAIIEGILWLGPPAGNALGRADITGSLNLEGCRAHEVVDHPGSWPTRRVVLETRKTLRTFVFLDGFTYDRMAGQGDYDARTRKKWLDRQPHRHLGVSFRPQPFEQLIKVYREMGHEGHARDIAKFKERRRYRSLFIKLWHGWRDRPKFFKSRFLAPLTYIAWPYAIVARVLYRSVATVFLAAIWAFVGFGTAYWHGWGRLMVFLLALWAAGGLFYREVAVQSSFAPSNPIIYLNKDIEAKCVRNWTDCKGAPPELPSFSPFTYSLDIMLPVLDLGQKHDWQPIDRPGKPVVMVFPSITWEPGYDLPSDVPHIRIDERPLAEGTVEKIVTAQTMLSWGVLGLLLTMLLRVIRGERQHASP
jgi:hypothetical protein